jgi:DNA-binding XRE family transcriptional regulator
MTPLELKEARSSLGLTQEKLATELGVHRFTVLRWESGEHKIPRMLDLALKQLKREHRLETAQPQRGNRRRPIKSQDDTTRTGTEAGVSPKPKPAKLIFQARGEMDAGRIEFSSASVAIVVPHARITNTPKSNRGGEPSIVAGESSDNKKPDD